MEHGEKTKRRVRVVPTPEFNYSVIWFRSDLFFNWTDYLNFRHFKF